MGKSFLVNIDCSKIFQNSEAAKYAMFIDSSKMSIVYEFVEWLRWMFSLKSCIYLMHENSVIHELEDIQLLSELKNFEIVPCGEHDCAHKKTYRTLLENLNLIVSWKNTKVHKYFLDKINQMSERLTQANTQECNNLPNATIQNLITFNSETENYKTVNSVENSLQSNENQELETSSIGEPISKKLCTADSCCKSATGEETPSVMISSFGKEITEKENILNQFDKTPNDIIEYRNSENQSSEANRTSTENPDKSISDKSPVKKKIAADQRNNKHHTKSKPVKPFSVGDILSIIRKDSHENNMENNSPGSENASVPSVPSAPEERNIEAKTPTSENSSSVQDGVTTVKTRQRTRKRKRPKRQLSEDQGYIPLEMENKNSLPPLRIDNLYYKVKPHHIRFDLDEDVNNFNHGKNSKKKSECVEACLIKEVESNSEKVNNGSSMEDFKNEYDKLISFLNNVDQEASQKPKLCSSEKNVSQNRSFLSSDEIIGEDIVFYSDRINQSSNSLENVQSSNSSHDLNDLLSLKEKYKNGIVIQRF